MRRASSLPVFDQRDAPVFVADDEIGVAIAIPIERNGDDHLELHTKAGPEAPFTSRPAAYAGAVRVPTFS